MLCLWRKKLPPLEVEETAHGRRALPGPQPRHGQCCAARALGSGLVGTALGDLSSNSKPHANMLTAAARTALPQESLSHETQAAKGL